MEDLNETGFADPKNLTADDLPLIVSRLEIINAVLLNADDFMTPHLLEAQRIWRTCLARQVSIKRLSNWLEIFRPVFSQKVTP